MNAGPPLRALCTAAMVALGQGAANSGCSSSSPASADGGPPAFVYTPKGCSYSYAPPSTLGFLSLALDDAGPVNASSGKPARVRVGLGGGVKKGAPGYADPTRSATFTWETAEENHAARVKLGTSASAMTTVQTGYSWATPGSLGGPPTYMHEVHVCGLEPGVEYFYQVGGGPESSPVYSATQNFSTVPASGTITVGVFSDARDTVSTWQAVHERMREAGVSLQLIAGDLVDAAALEKDYTQWLDAIWLDPNDTSKFLTLGQQIMVPIGGNHENDQPNAFAAWSIPGVAGDPYAETYASFDLGAAHFALIDDFHISSLTAGAHDAVAEKQLAWLDADLKAAAADRSAHPFIVVLNHRGLFSTSNHAEDSDVLATRGALAPIFDKYAVDLVINGHDHEYERSKPLKANAKSPESDDVILGSGGTTYVISAGAGAEPYPTVSHSQAYAVSGVQTGFCTSANAPGCTSPYIGVYGVLTLTASSMKLTAYGLKASSTSMADDTVIDTVTFP